MTAFTALISLAGALASGQAPPPPAAKVSLTTLAYRVHKMPAMVAFYTEAFGARFREVDTGGIRSQFGELPGLTLKFVPIRDGVEFVEFPIHQPGFEVASVSRVIELALKHGGKVENPPSLQSGRTHAAVRDPDGNTLELYGGR